MEPVQAHIAIRVAHGGYIVDFEYPGTEDHEGGVSSSVFTSIEPMLSLIRGVVMMWEGPLDGDAPIKVSDVTGKKK